MELQEKITQGAFELFMQYGIKSVSMDDLAQKLGMSKKTIYTFIENKKELVNTVITRHIADDEKIINAIIATSTDAIDEMINITRHMQQFLRQMKPSLIYDLKKYYRESWNIIEETHFSYIHHVIRQNIERGIAEGLYRDNIHPEIVARLYTRISEGFSDEKLFPLNEFTRLELYEQNVRYHMNGIVNMKGKKMLERLELTLNQNK